MFAIQSWNQYRPTIEERPRHNNFVESNNYKLQKLLCANPSAWDFMLGLRSAYRGDFELGYNVSPFLAAVCLIPYLLLCRTSSRECFAHADPRTLPVMPEFFDKFAAGKM
jgi:hypothetical protein